MTIVAGVGAVLGFVPQMLKLAFPIFIEIMLRTLMGNIDQFMLSRYSSTAVASVGNANQVMNMMILVLNVVCVASSISELEKGKNCHRFIPSRFF